MPGVAVLTSGALMSPPPLGRAPTSPRPRPPGASGVGAARGGHAPACPRAGRAARHEAREGSRPWNAASRLPADRRDGVLELLHVRANVAEDEEDELGLVTLL